MVKIFSNVFVLVTIAYFSSTSLAEISGTPLEVIKAYQEALATKNLDAMESTVSMDLVVLEGMHLDKGWKSFRNDHIGKEMKDWESFKIKSSKPIFTDESTDRALYIIESINEMKMAKETVSFKSLDTYVLKKIQKSWKIIHIHSSAKRL